MAKTSTISPTQPIESPNLSEWIPSPLYRMTLEQYEAMVDSGAFNEHDRFHLINGCLVAKMTQGDPHCVADDLCRNALTSVLPPRWFVRSNKPVILPPNSKPEPDHAIVRGGVRDYVRSSPRPADVAMIVEVADSSLSEDRRKGDLYAAAGILIYWIVNLVDRQVEVYSSPNSAGYSSRADFHPGENVPVVLDDVQVGFIAVDEIMP